MLIELIDDLRCPRSHEETWLVASANRVVDRDIIDGTLGCPICHAEYPIRAGVVWFDDVRPVAPPGPRVGAERAMRLAAFLDLSDSQGFAVLTGSYGSAAELLRGVVSTHLVALNAPVPVSTGSGVSVLVIRRGIPVAAATCRGVALDSHHADAAYLDEALRVLQPRGRLVAPATARIPNGVTELARDDELWVAERTAAPPKLVTLRGRGGR